MDQKNYLELITAFNSDKEIIALREKYKEPTFFEIISKQRSETTYSSFLKWMFQSSSTDLNSVSPILLLLDILVKRSEEQNRINEYIEDEFKRDIVTRNFQINSIEVETEKSVGVLVGELKDKWGEAEKLKSDEQEKLIQKCQDRIDIFIKCKLDNGKELQVIIENKIDSTEGISKNTPKTYVDTYDTSDQTERYYIATKRGKNKELKQLYIYLSPSTENECNCSNFIRITYQDIIDGIIIPMLSTTSLSSRARFFLEELKTELTFPSLEGNNVKSSIAISNENSERFGNLWKEHGQLIIDAAIATSQSTIWYIEDTTGNVENKEIVRFYYDHPPKSELLEKIPDEQEKQKLKNKTRLQYKIVIKSINGFKDKGELASLNFGECKCNDTELLRIFWDNNKRFLLAIMNGLPKEERKKIECLTTEVSKRDNTKYRVYYGTGQDSDLNKKWLTKDKGANNSETAWMIIRAWVEMKMEGNVTLQELNTAFPPKQCNEYYYKNNKIFNNLFYSYIESGIYQGDQGTDYENVQIEAGGWDLYKPKDENDRKFRIHTTYGDVIMLKVWRKNDLHKLIEHVKKITKGELSIQPDR